MNSDSRETRGTGPARTSRGEHEGDEERAFQAGGPPRPWMPLQALSFESLEDGRVVIIRPKLLHDRWKWVVKLLAKPDFRVKLDEKGSFIWGICDGAHTVQEIAAAVRERFGPAHSDERTGWFIKQLRDGGFVR